MKTCKTIKLFCVIVALSICLSACLAKPGGTDNTFSDDTVTDSFTPAVDNADSSELGKKYNEIQSLIASGEKLIFATETDFICADVSGGVEITDYIGAYKSEYESDYIILVIPEKIGDKSVVSIGKEAFAIVAHLDAVVIPDSVTTIDSLAFYGCNYLKYVQLGKSVRTIGDYAFSMCPSLFNVDLSTVDGIGLGALIGCQSINSITLPFVGGGSEENAFLGYIFGATDVELNAEFVPDSLRSVILTDRCKVISDFAFYNCKNIMSVIISDSVESIGVRAFGKCRSIIDINVGGGVKTIADDAFFGCDSLKSIKLGSALESLGMQAFFGCTALEKIEIPATLSEIKASTFYGCAALKEIDLANIKTIGKDAFGGCDLLTPPDISRVENIAEGNDNLYKH